MRQSLLTAKAAHRVNRRHPPASWVLVPALLTVAIALAACGGQSEKDAADPEACSSADPAWRRIAAQGQSPQRARHSAVWTGSEVIVWGGIDEHERPLHSGYRIDQNTGTVRPVSEEGAPSARLGHFAAWTGTEMIVWGGFDSIDDRTLESLSTWGEEALLSEYDGLALAGGGLYDPEVDRWRPLRMEGGPGPRACAAVTWTQRGLFVWGGADWVRGPGHFDGYLYDPVSNSWQAITQEGAHPAFCNPWVLATDRDVILVGGTDNSIDWHETWGHVTGYDLETGSWRDLETEGAVLDRAYNLKLPAFWTGSDAIFCWPDSECHAYRPTADAWRALSTEHAPGWRARAAWTSMEHKFLIFGGYEAFQMNPGGNAYDLTNDSWEMLPDECQPSPRFDASLTWTDVGAVLWGGRTYGEVTGGRGLVPGRTLPEQGWLLRRELIGE
jgi:hypothetical protein